MIAEAIFTVAVDTPIFGIIWLINKRDERHQETKRRNQLMYHNQAMQGREYDHEEMMKKMELKPSRSELVQWFFDRKVDE